MMNILDAKEVEYQYPDSTKALCGVDLEVKKGKKTAILGPNGAGKTTLLYLFNGTLKPSEGAIFLNGTSMRYDARSLREVRRTVGMVFQNPDDQLFAPTVKQDVSFGPLNLKLSMEEAERKVSESLKIVGMTGFEKNPPHHLSTGQKKRVAIAGILAMDPEILIFDEPLSGLDPHAQADLIEMLDEFNAEGKTIVISTHDVNLASTWTDEIYLLQKGEVYAAGSPREIFADEELITGANLRSPMVVKTHREFEAHNIYERQDKVPLSILDLIENLNGSAKKEGGKIWVVQIPGMKHGGVSAVDLDELRKVLDLTPDRTSAMGTSAKECVKRLGIVCDFEHDVVDTSISEAMRGANVLIFASGGMADIVVERARKKGIRCGNAAFEASKHLAKRKGDVVN